MGWGTGFTVLWRARVIGLPTTRKAVVWDNPTFQPMWLMAYIVCICYVYWGLNTARLEYLVLWCMYWVVMFTWLCTNIIGMKYYAALLVASNVTTLMLWTPLVYNAYILCCQVCYAAIYINATCLQLWDSVHACCWRTKWCKRVTLQGSKLFSQCTCLNLPSAHLELPSILLNYQVISTSPKKTFEITALPTLYCKSTLHGV